MKYDVKILCGYLRKAGVSIQEMANAFNELNRVLDKLEKEDSYFKAYADYMRYRCLPWYKKFWIWLKGVCYGC